MAGAHSRYNLQPPAGLAEHAAEGPESAVSVAVVESMVLAEFPLTRAEIGSFRQIKTSTREKDYCICIFEHQQQHQRKQQNPQSVQVKARQEPGERPITTWL